MVCKVRLREKADVIILEVRLPAVMVSRFDPLPVFVYDAVAFAAEGLGLLLTLLTGVDEPPRLNIEPLTFEYVMPTQRSYK